MPDTTVETTLALLSNDSQNEKKNISPDFWVVVHLHSVDSVMFVLFRNTINDKTLT